MRSGNDPVAGPYWGLLVSDGHLTVQALSSKRLNFFFSVMAELMDFLPVQTPEGILFCQRICTLTSAIHKFLSPPILANL